MECACVCAFPVCTLLTAMKASKHCNKQKPIMDRPVLNVQASVPLDAITVEAQSSLFRVSNSPTEMVKNGVVKEVDARIRQTWDKTKGVELGMSDHYTSIAVLIVHWAKNLDEGLESWKEAEELHQIFRDDLNFKSRVVTLDNTTKRPQLQLSKALMDFVHEYDGPHRTNLLIVYYTGHGFKYTDKPHELFISGTEDGNLTADNDSHRPQASWTTAEAPLDDALADTLVVLDCCYAGSIMKGVSEHSRSYELMVATGKDKPTAAGPKSYTTAFIKSLRILQSEQQPFTTYDLSQMIIRERGWNSSSQLYTRKPNFQPRHIVIAPPVEPSKSPFPKPGNCAGYLDLRIAFEDNIVLEDEQVRLICSALCKLPKSTALKICDLEFLGFTPCRESSQFRKLVEMRHMIGKAVKRFKAKTQRQIEEADDPTINSELSLQESAAERSTSRQRSRKRQRAADALTSTPQEHKRRRTRQQKRSLENLGLQPPLTPSVSSRGVTPNT